jgi:hypothetical protein
MLDVRSRSKVRKQVRKVVLVLPKRIALERKSGDSDEVFGSDQKDI